MNENKRNTRPTQRKPRRKPQLNKNGIPIQGGDRPPKRLRRRDVDED